MAGKKTAKKKTAAKPAPTESLLVLGDEPASEPPAKKSSKKATAKEAAKKATAKKAGKKASSKKAANVRAQIGLDAITIEGGLLSPSWLSRIAQASAPHQSELDYAVPKGLTLRDEIGRYWRIAQAHWAEFDQGRASPAVTPPAAGDMPGLFDRIPDEAALVRRFVLGLLRECFGFASIREVEPLELDERSYPIGHSALEGRVPIVLAPAGLGLDTPDVAFGEDKRRRSPFGLLQEYLNADEAALWGLVCDGLTLRVVRDNASLTRPAWIEVDLARIFAENRHAEFAALWLLLHASRFGRPDQPVTECALEAWRNAGVEEGTRARESLRKGVEDAVEALGQGFLAHPDNRELRSALESGSLTKADYFNQLLRVVYRVIFLLTIEERGLLHAPGSDEQAQALYAEGYGLRRLRDRAVRRNAHDRFSDVWESIKIVFRGLAKGEPRLALPALAGLFAAKQCPDVDTAKLENHVFLRAMFQLSWLRQEGALARVNWRDMGAEELGSVYESLFELVPRISKDGREFGWSDESRGNARKSSGSYYTPDTLVKLLLDNTLEPVIEDTIAKNPQREVDALLALSIVDPACGSGHFLLGAARRLAGHVARKQVSGTPSMEDYRHAVRQVVGRCIYGVDLNPMAVDLCKVSLWLEAVDPGKPLSFLDPHIQQGNSIMGTAPDLMADGIPDSAWEPIEGDDRKVASLLRRRNKKSAAESQRLLEELWVTPSDTQVRLAAEASQIDGMPDSDVAALASKEVRWDDYLVSEPFLRQRELADLWCLAFVWNKQSEQSAGEHAPTNELWWKARSGQEIPTETKNELCSSRTRYSFFHWHVQFPQIAAQGGFSVVIGNPPWERVKLQELEFFSSRNAEIYAAPNAAARKVLIAALEHEDPPHLWLEWKSAGRKAEGESHFIRHSGRFPLCGKGDVNTYAIFAELCRTLMGPRGRAGFICPTGIVTDEGSSAFFSALVDAKQLARFESFENFGVSFAGVNNRQSFSCMMISNTPVERIDLCFNVNQDTGAAAGERAFQLRSSDFRLLNPNTGTCPTFRSPRDAALNTSIYEKVGVLWNESSVEDGNPWAVRFMAMFHMANDSGLFSTRSSLGEQIDQPERWRPLVEAKMVSHFDHHYASFIDDGDTAGRTPRKFSGWYSGRANDPFDSIRPQYWVSKDNVEQRLAGRWDRGWLLGWRDICRSTDRRTVVASLIPRTAVNDKFLLLFPQQPPNFTACLYACLCSFILDYAARQKVGGTSLKYFTIKQLPVLAPLRYAALSPWDHNLHIHEWISRRVAELVFTAWDIESFALDLGFACPPFQWSASRREILRAELDAAFFHLYDLARQDVEYVMGTFAVVRKVDEKAHGEYRTKRLILEIYDEMAEAIRTGKPYQTRLDPPPADPSLTHPPREPAKARSKKR